MWLRLAGGLRQSASLAPNPHSDARTPPSDGFALPVVLTGVLVLFALSASAVAYVRASAVSANRTWQEQQTHQAAHAVLMTVAADMRANALIGATTSRRTSSVTLAGERWIVSIVRHAALVDINLASEATFVGMLLLAGLDDAHARAAGARILMARDVARGETRTWNPSDVTESLLAAAGLEAELVACLRPWLTVYGSGPIPVAERNIPFLHPLALPASGPEDLVSIGEAIELTLHPEARPAHRYTAVIRLTVDQDRPVMIHAFGPDRSPVRPAQPMCRTT